MGKAGHGDEGRMDAGGTADTVMGGGEWCRAPGKPPRESPNPEADERHLHKDTKEAACGKAGGEDHCDCDHVDVLIRSYPRMGRDALIKRIDKLQELFSGIFEDQAIFDNDVKTIRIH